MNRRGFTLIELLTRMSIIGLLASIALPKYQNLRQRATAAEIVSNMRTLRRNLAPDHRAWDRARRSVQTIQVRLTDGTLCQSLYGLLGGRRSGDLRASCNRQGGNVFLTVDR